MRPFFYLLLLLFYSISHTTYSQKLVFEENFYNNNGWLESKTENYSFYISQGKYFIENYQPSGYATTLSIPINESKDFTIESSINKVSGSDNTPFGIQWGIKDVDYQYEFLVAINGYFMIRKISAGESIEIKPWTTTEELNKSNGVANLIAVKKTGNFLAFLINNRSVYQMPYTSFFGDKIGFIAYNETTISVNNLKVFERENNFENKTLLNEKKDIVFQDNFKNNELNWSVGETDDYNLHLDGGRYYFEHKKSNGSWNSTYKTNINLYDDFQIDVVLEKNGGVDNYGYGLLFGRQDNRHQFEFVISGNGHFNITETGENPTVNTEWIASDLINQGIGSVNKLSIRKKGNKFLFLINESIAHETQAKAFYGTSVGFVIHENQSIAIDQLSIAKIEALAVANNGPEIVIYSPMVNRGIKILQHKNITVKGRAVDSDGIYEIVVNGIDAHISQDGSFTVEIPLAVGENTINIQATDIKHATSQQSFKIKREAEPIEPTVNQAKRVALVIGNAQYTGVADLGENPINDALEMAATLESLGFEVIKKTNVDYSSMREAIRDFGRMNSDAEVALFFFAGHGMQVDQKNYLLPTKVSLKEKSDVSFECIEVDMVQKVMEGGNTNNRLNLIILDACRNNPFKAWNRSGNGGGLAGMTPPSGTLIAFATSPGSTAANGTGSNGLYTGELIKQLKKPQRIEDVFINTRIAVEDLSGGKQSPWELARLRGIYFLRK